VKNVTAIMSFLVQSCHSKIPPDVLEPIIKAIADQFVTDRSSPEAMAVGINSIRYETCLFFLLFPEQILLVLFALVSHWL
jgi:protein SDA1